MKMWYRVGSFVQSFVHGDGRVYYAYISDKIEYVKKIILCLENYSDDASAYLHLDPSPFYEPELQTLTNKLFNHVDNQIQVHLGFGKIRIKIDDDFMSQFFTFIQSNESLKSQFTDEICKEISDFYYHIMAKKTFKHRIPEYKPVNNSNIASALTCSMYEYLEYEKDITPDLEYVSAHDSIVDKAMKSSNKLTMFFHAHNNSQPNAAMSSSNNKIMYLLHNSGRRPNSVRNNSILLFKILHVILISGEDPNQKDNGGSCLTKAILMFYDISIIKLLLFYGSRFDVPDDYNALTPIEYALQEKQYHVVDLFIAAITQLEKPIPLAHQIVTCDFHPGEKKIVSSLRFQGGTLLTTLKSSMDLTSEEREGLKRLYDMYFEGENAGQVALAPEPNKFVDVIRHESGKIIGMVFHKVRFIKNDIWVNVDLALFDTAHTNFGIMPIVIYRFPYSLQALFPKANIRMVFFAAHYNAIKTVQGSPNIPHWQPTGRVQETVEVLLSQFNYKLTLENSDPTLCYVVEDHSVTVKGASQSKNPDFAEEIYQRFRGYNNRVDEKAIKQRDVLVELPANDKHFAGLYAIASARNINFYQLVSDFAKALKASRLVHTKEKTVQPRLYKARESFWENKQVEVDEVEYKELQSQPQYKSNTVARL